MLSAERKIIDWCDRHKLLLFAALISIIAAVMRLNMLDAKSVDYSVWLKPWYDEIVSKGGLAAVSSQIGDYNVLYQLLIALLSYLPIHPLTLYKGLSVLFDYLLAVCAAWIVYDICRLRIKAVLAYTCVLLLPSIFINSAYWAQCDSIYSFFLLAMVCFLLKQKHFLAIVSFAIAFQFKLQAVFALPFLLYYYVGSKKFSILNFAVVPLLSVAICLLCRRNPFETFSIYAAQTNTWPGMAHGFPSIWNLISDDYPFLRNTAILLTIAILGIGLVLILNSKLTFDTQNTFNILIWSLWTCLLFLPALHDRYAYFLLILLLLSSILNYRMSGYLLACELVILISYSRFLWPYSAAAKVPHYLCSMVFVFMYASFIHECFIKKVKWMPAKAMD